METQIVKVAEQLPSETLEEESELAMDETPTPAATLLPIIEEVPGCEKGSTGHLLFLSNEFYKRLYIMDGNGCNVYKIMEDASGSPDWSVDGKKIAVGCDNNRQICILDAEQTFASCRESEGIGTCEAVILEKYPLPGEEGERMIYDLSWSGDSSTLLVGFAVLPEKKNIYLLHLEDPLRWELLVESSLMKADYSPTEEIIMFDGIMEFDLQTKVIEYHAVGNNPQWSSDGKYVAMLNFYPKDDIEPAYLSYMEMPETGWIPLYEPRPYDPENWQRRNVIFSDNEYRILSWSPDSKYIAFVGDYRHEGDSQIFRLDIETGEIFVLTTKLDSVYGEMQYIAPAWGP